MHLSSASADYISDATLRLCFGRAVFCCPFPGELGSTTAHLRRLPRKGRAGGAYKSLLASRAGAQPCQRCSPVLQALIIFQMQFYGSASAEPFFVAPFPENWGARLRISGGCPARRAGGAQNPCSSIACRAQPCQRCSQFSKATLRCAEPEALKYLSQYAFTALLRQSHFVLLEESAAKGAFPLFCAADCAIL